MLVSVAHDKSWAIWRLGAKSKEKPLQFINKFAIKENVFFTFCHFYDLLAELD